jgi:hypothetical protein
MFNNVTRYLQEFHHINEKYENIIRYYLLYFSLPSRSNYFGCKIDKYYDIFYEKIMYKLQLTRSDKLLQYNKDIFAKVNAKVRQTGNFLNSLQSSATALTNQVNTMLGQPPTTGQPQTGITPTTGQPQTGITPTTGTTTGTTPLITQPPSPTSQSSSVPAQTPGTTTTTGTTGITPTSQSSSVPPAAQIPVSVPATIPVSAAAPAIKVGDTVKVINGTSQRKPFVVGNIFIDLNGETKVHPEGSKRHSYKISELQVVTSQPGGSLKKYTKKNYKKNSKNRKNKKTKFGKMTKKRNYKHKTKKNT